MKRSMTGFTIVELLIVIIVIAILAAISIVAYNGITRRAVESMLKQDLASANKQIAAYRATNDSLPLANNCPSPATTEICLAGSAGTTFTYSPNSPTSPTQYQILATNGTVSFRSSNGSSPELAYGSRFVALTNLVQNGDFSAGQTGWTIHCQNSTQCLFSGGVLTIIADPSGRSDVRQSIMTSYSDGDRIFYSVRIRKDSGSGFHTGAYRDNGGFVSYLVSAVQFNAASTGQFARYSVVRNFVASQGTFTSLHIGVASITPPGPTYQITADDVVIINLTAAFGAGNEPSAAAMEGILSQFENGWFSGTVSATY